MGMYVSNITSKHDPQTIFYISTFLGICCIVLKNKTKKLHQILSVISSFWKHYALIITMQMYGYK